MLSSKSFVVGSCFIFCFAAWSTATDYNKKKVGVIKDGCLSYNLYLSFKAQPEMKSFVNLTKRRLVFYNPEESTIELDANTTKIAPWAFKLSKEVHLSYRNMATDRHRQLPNLRPTTFLAEGIYIFSEKLLEK